MLRVRNVFLLILCLMSAASAADRFVGWQGCASSACHGGGAGADQLSIWQKKDAHSRSQGILTSGRSAQIAEALGVGDAWKSAQCTVCHSPMQNVPERLLAKDVKPNLGVACETCHGPAENWQRSHTRKDITHAQRIAMGMHDLDSSYQRANTCAGCHINLPAPLQKAGHPELRFELARQLIEMPPHWAGANPAGREWLTSQAVLLRELCWQSERGTDNAARIAALAWLLRETPLGAEYLPTDLAPQPLRKAADKLARAASSASWNDARTRSQYQALTQLVAQLGEEKAVAFRRAEVLVPALRAIALAMGAPFSAKAKDPLASLDLLVRIPLMFDAKKFAEAAAQLPVAGAL